MSKRRRPRPTPRFLFVDGEAHLIVERTGKRIVMRRLLRHERARVERALDDVQYELEAELIGFRGRPTRRP